MTVDTVDRRVLETRALRRAGAVDRDGARRLALLGRPLRGLELRVVDPDTGAVLARARGRRAARSAARR